MVAPDKGERDLQDSGPEREEIPQWVSARFYDPSVDSKGSLDK